MTLKRTLGLLMLLLLCCSITAIAEVESIDLSFLTGDELHSFSAQTDEVIELYHEPDSEARETALSMTKEAVEEYFASQGIEISWAWIDYTYTKDWDYYTLSTPVTYKDANKKKHELDVYAELFPENGRHGSRIHPAPQGTSA